MATLTEYFETEASEFLTQLDAGLARRPVPDLPGLHRAARGLRGTAQIAREQRVFRAVGAFEAVARALATNALGWSEEIGARARESVADLRVLVRRDAADAELDARAAAAVARWSDLGVELPAHLAGSMAPAAAAQSDIREFREFAAREVAGVSDALDKAVQQLAAAPMDREPLKAILRRQRALLGATRLDEIPVVAEILRAIEDLTRIIVKLDVGVKQEWLDVYRVAREGLKATIEPLERNEDPVASHPVSRLRHMREELLERYGAGDLTTPAQPKEGAHSPSLEAQVTAALQSTDQSTPEPDDEPDLIGAAASAMQRAVGTASAAVSAGVAAAAGAVQAVAETIVPAAAPTDAVPIEQLVYNREAALRRALELREIIMRVAQNDPHVRDAVDELFDLIRLAQS